MTLEQQLAQKIMLDFRYYCPDFEQTTVASDDFSNDLEGYKEADKLQQYSGQKCYQPLTQLPTELADLIRSTSLGGVILFADNLVSSEQIVQLTSDLQNAALQSSSGLPLFISVDQEGGRVVRLPRDITTSFTSNMAIGATYPKHGDYYAKAVGQTLGSELSALGFNVDHAPVVDVNVNPDNPVINVRSFGENPQMVANLGLAMLDGMQEKGLIGTLKHFPGHGDTNTDSHTGLPVVHHKLATVEKVDLYPFQQAIDHGDVKMIMTAHIQYPALDNSLMVNKRGESMIKPATLSKKILTDLLREKMGYQGLVITDALDMAGISDFFTPLEAVVNTFKAGADIALMPIKVRTPADINRVKRFIELLAQRIKDDPVAIQQVEDSIKRISKIKGQINAKVLSSDDIRAKQVIAASVLANKAHRALETKLAAAAITEIQNRLTQPDQLQNWQTRVKKVHLVFPQQGQAQAMQLALQMQLASLHKLHWQFSISTLENFEQQSIHQHISASDLVIIASDDSKLNVVEMGGVEDLEQLKYKESKLESQNSKSKDKISQVLEYAANAHKKTILIAFKNPYDINKYRQFADWILASYDGNFYKNAQGNYTGAAFSALAEIITGQLSPQGILPVTL